MFVKNQTKNKDDNLHRPVVRVLFVLISHTMRSTTLVFSIDVNFNTSTTYLKKEMAKTL